MHIRLHYTEQGSGFPLLLLHGNGEDGSYFVHQMVFFSQFYRVIAVDTRGHGKSPRGTAPFTIRQFADDLLTFLNQLNIDKADLLGFSDGGNIALTFSLAHPERVEKLILNGANLFPRGMQPLVHLGVHAEYLWDRIRGDQRHAELMQLMRKEPDISFDDLQTLSLPTLVVAGDHDMIRSSHTRRIAGSLPNAQLVILPGDHFVAKKQPDAFNRAVLSFLNPSRAGSTAG